MTLSSRGKRRRTNRCLTTGTKKKLPQKPVGTISMRNLSDTPVYWVCKLKFFWTAVNRFWFLKIILKDVTVLRKCCLNFRKLYMEISERHCPFSSGPTLASMVNVFWRTRFLPAMTIGVIKKITENRHQSAMGLKWLEWKANELALDIKTMMNGGENKIGKYFVDGFCEKTNQVFEFCGFYWHGCSNCEFKKIIFVHFFIFLRNLPFRFFPFFLHL